MKCKFMHVTLRSHILIIQNHALEDILLSAFDLAICTYLCICTLFTKKKSIPLFRHFNKVKITVKLRAGVKKTDIGGPLIGRFSGSRKNVLIENYPIRWVFMV